jgi:hypothetical protein
MVQRFFQYLEPTSELATHDRVTPVSLLDGAAGVGYGCAQMLRGKPILQLFETLLAHLGEEEANHRIREHSIDEVLDDLPKPGLSAEFFE